MNLLPLINKKREKQALTPSEIEAFVFSLMSKNRPPDYQVSSLLAFIVAHGMTDEETLNLTLAMKESGKAFEYKKGFGRGSIFVDKHSTGGVGDKITLPLAPLVVACSQKLHFPTIAGRGLGHTGGTVDKLESIPGLSTALKRQSFYKILSRRRACFLSQTLDIAPADRELYFLRDVTGTVASIPLITASILSKKLSESLDFLLIDLKTGSGAFLPHPEMTKALGESLLRVLKLSGVQAEVWMTNMDSPLGQYSGNRLEVLESLKILKGHGPSITQELTVLMAKRLVEVEKSDLGQSVDAALASGRAYEIFESLCADQGGRIDRVEKVWKQAKLKTKTIKARQTGYLKINSTLIGLGLVELGAGRKKKTDKIDPDVGIEHWLTSGAEVKAGQELLKIFYRKDDRLRAASPLFQSGLEIVDRPPTVHPLIIAKGAASSTGATWR